MSKVKITRHESVQVLVYSYVEGEGGKEGREREGMEEGRGKETEGMGGTEEDMGWDEEGRERERRKGREREERSYRATAPKLQFLVPPLPNTTVDGVDVVVCGGTSGLSQSHNGLQT